MLSNIFLTSLNINPVYIISLESVKQIQNQFIENTNPSTVKLANSYWRLVLYADDSWKFIYVRKTYSLVLSDSYAFIVTIIDNRSRCKAKIFRFGISFPFPIVTKTKEIKNYLYDRVSLGYSVTKNGSLVKVFFDLSSMPYCWT